MRNVKNPKQKRAAPRRDGPNAEYDRLRSFSMITPGMLSVFHFFRAGQRFYGMRRILAMARRIVMVLPDMRIDREGSFLTHRDQLSPA